MKKSICRILVAIMIFSCVLSGVTVSAEEKAITLGKNEMVEMSGFLADKLVEMGELVHGDASSEEAGADRTMIANFISAYFETRTGINSLITILENESAGDGDDESTSILDSLLDNSAAELDEYKDQIAFTLRVYACTKDADRQDAIARFYSDEEIELSEDEASALEYFYDILVPADVQDILKGEDSSSVHNVTAATLLNLLTPFKGCVRFTDDEVGGNYIDVAYIGSDFNEMVLEYLADYQLNGEAITDGEALMLEVADVINDEANFSLEEIADIKLVLGAAGLYREKEDKPARRPNPTFATEEATEDSSDATEEPSDDATEEPTEEPEFIEEPEVIPAPEASKDEFVFEDTKGHWAKDYVGYLAEKNIFKGYEDNSFKPEMGITREELAVVIVRVLGIEVAPADELQYTDSSDIAEWSKDYVAYATERGIYTGYDDGSFMPKKIITREELVTILMRAIDSNKMLAELTYLDKDDIGHWSEIFVNKATALGIVSGYDDGNFKPGISITRAEAAKMIYNFIQVNAD